MLNPLDGTVRFLDRCVIPAFLSRFFRARQGAVMIYVAMLLPVFFGVAMLTVDGARLFNLQTSLQNGVDAFALAGAKELDGKATSIIRSDSAIANLVSNSSKFGAGGVNIAVTQRYLWALPPFDRDDVETVDCAGGISCVTVDPALAQYVEVTVTPASGSFNTIFPAGIFGKKVLTTAATAIAGFDAVVCEFTPIFICNPFEETDGVDILDAVGETVEAKNLRRRLIDLRMQGGGGGQYSPGNYGFLEPVGSNPGANALRDMIGMSNPPACFSQNGVTLRPGFVATVRDAVNVRFDMYNGPMNSKKNDEQFRPAKNVRKGYEGNSPCNTSEAPYDPDADPPVPPTSLPLGRDHCFATNSCDHMPEGGPNGRMGDGVWDFDLYWQTNFPTEPIPTNADGPYQCANAGSCSNPPSRYEIYRHEIDAGLADTPDNPVGGTPNPSPGGEYGGPMCSNSATSDDPDRRMLYGAIINCREEELAPGQSGPYQVEAFAKFFITEPVKKGGNDIYVELVDIFEPGGGGSGTIIRAEVQLYS